MQPITLGHLSAWHHPSTLNGGQKKIARILLLHGISEHSGRHLNTVNWFTQRGVEVIRFDFRGAGQSGGRAQWIEQFNDYVEDTIDVFLWIQRNLDRQPLYVLGHSLGGAIALHFAAHYGNQFDGLMLSAPAFLTGSNIPMWKIAVGKALVRFFPKLRIPTVGDNKALSRIPEVATEYGKDPLSYHYNTLRQGDQVLQALEKVPVVARAITLPTIIAHGTADRIVRHDGSFQILKSLASSDKELHFLPGGFHEPHNDINQNEYFQLLTVWMGRQLQKLGQVSHSSERESFLGFQGISSNPSS